MNNIFDLLLALLPISFFLQLVITEQLFLKKGIKYGGFSPINEHLFKISKYSVLIIWLGMILDIYGINFMPIFIKNNITKYSGLFFWITGFALLYIGRFSLGNNFRIGIANEKTRFIAKGVYTLSRNPMYLGLYATFIGCMLYTLNLLYILISLFIIAVHHSITLGEEKELLRTYGNTYKEYCKKVRRYI
jgi:protein-S-isoprenylcysteine O-methyltransferase Ste14